MSHNSNSSYHEKSRNLRSLQAVASVILWKLCIIIMPTQDECVCVCAVGSSSEWMDELSDFNVYVLSISSWL